MNNSNADVRINGSVLWDPRIQRKLQYTIHGIAGVNQPCKYPFNIAEYWWKVELRRKIKPYLIQTYIPTTIIVMASFATFLIPPDSYPGRLGFLAGLVLCLINILLNTLSNAPNVERVNELPKWVVLCIGIVALVFMEYFVLLLLMRYKKVDQENFQVVTIEENPESPAASEDEPKSTNTLNTKRVDFFALLVGSILFFIVALIYFLTNYNFKSTDADTGKNLEERFLSICKSLV